MNADRNSRGSFAARLLAAAVGGALVAACFLDFSLFPLAWVAFVPLLGALSAARTTREAAWLGLAAGLATNVAAFHWLAYTIHVFGGFPLVVAAFFYGCLSLYSACQFVLFALAFRRVGFGPLGLAVPVAWVALEFVFPNLFPWRMASSQLQVPLLLQVGDVTGPFGLSFAIVWVNAGIALAWQRPRRWAPLAAAAASVALIAAYGWVRMPVVQAAIDAAQPVRVGLVQGNVGLVEKGDTAFFEVNEERYRELSRELQDRVDVVFWPETVSQEWIPAGASRLPTEANPFVDLKRFLVYGGLSFAQNGEGKYDKFNSAFLLGPEGRVLGRYDKRILMPFGEFLPGASLFPALQQLSPATGDFSAGRRIATLDVPDRVRIAPLICYEDVPAGIAREMTRKGAEALLTMFNDAWFGETMAPYQHEALALWRAIENRRYFIRVGNAGATGVIDPFGRVVDRLGLFSVGTVVAEIRPLRLETFYTRHGEVFAGAVLVLALLWLAAAVVRDRRAGLSSDPTCDPAAGRGQSAPAP